MAENPQAPPGFRMQRDRYPRMILVCIGITMVLSTIIIGVLVVDFVLRDKMKKTTENPAAFNGMLEKPREAYQPAN